MQVDLAQNIAAVVAHNNQPILQKLDDAGAAFKAFTEHAIEQNTSQTKEIASLKGRIAQLESEKKTTEEAHKSDIQALQATIASLQTMLASLTQKVESVSSQAARTQEDLAKFHRCYVSHTHNVSWPGGPNFNCSGPGLK